MGPAGSNPLSGAWRAWSKSWAVLCNSCSVHISNCLAHGFRHCLHEVFLGIVCLFVARIGHPHQYHLFIQLIDVVCEHENAHTHDYQGSRTQQFTVLFERLPYNFFMIYKKNFNLQIQQILSLTVTCTQTFNPLPFLKTKTKIIFNVLSNVCTSSCWFFHHSCNWYTFGCSWPDYLPL